MHRCCLFFGDACIGPVALAHVVPALRPGTVHKAMLSLDQSWTYQSAQHVQHDRGSRAAEHNPDDPEYSILKQRLACKCRGEGVDHQTLKSWQLPDLTKVVCP